jgi:glutaredoxin
MNIEIYGTERCGYCKQAVLLCESKALQYKYVDVGVAENLQKLIERMGIRPRTVPQIFMDGDLVSGGFLGLQQELGKLISI